MKYGVWIDRSAKYPAETSGWCFDCRSDLNCGIFLNINDAHKAMADLQAEHISANYIVKERA